MKDFNIEQANLNEILMDFRLFYIARYNECY